MEANMHKHCFVFLCVLCLVQLSAAQHKERINVPFVDNTLQGSPFELTTGRVVLEETAAGNQLQSSWGEKVAVKNTSEKPILLVVATLSLVGRHNHGQRRGPGGGVTYVVADDRFFRADVIKPGDTLVLHDTEPDRGQTECCINPLEPANEPKAEFQVRFVQFVDGSTFGDPSQAKDDLAMRASIFKGLRQLVQSSSQRGEQGFLAETKRQTPWSNTFIFGDIWTSYEQKGFADTVARAQQILAVAESHEASIHGNVRR
jgi:hypothetical protein